MKSMSKIYLLLLFSSLFVFLNCVDICDENYCSSDGFACYDKDPTNNILCDNKCRPKYGEEGRCYPCDENPEFYSITFSNDIISVGPPYTCGVCNGDIILPSKECTDDPTGLKKLGEIYYKECPSYSRVNGESNICDCENMYYEETLNSKIKITCLSSTSACPDTKKFYDYGSKECYNSNCRDSSDLKKYEKNGNIRCSSSCIGDEFYKASGSSEICVDSCDRYIFFDSVNHKKYCKDDCSGAGLKKKIIIVSIKKNAIFMLMILIIA